MRFRFLLLMVFVVLFIVPDDVSGWWRRRRRRRRRCNTPDTTRVGYHNVWDGRLRFTCPYGQSVSGVYSKYSTCHRDRVFKISCRSNSAMRIGARCTWTHHYVNDWDRPINFRCHNHGFITGIESYHHNSHEDRRFKFRCCHSRRYIPYRCHKSPYVNSWKSTINYHLPWNYHLVGASSYHDNGHEDRRWSFTYCQLYRYNW